MLYFQTAVQSKMNNGGLFQPAAGIQPKSDVNSFSDDGSSSEIAAASQRRVMVRVEGDDNRELEPTGRSSRWLSVSRLEHHQETLLPIYTHLFCIYVFVLYPVNLSFRFSYGCILYFCTDTPQNVYLARWKDWKLMSRLETWFGPCDFIRLSNGSDPLMSQVDL